MSSLIAATVRSPRNLRAITLALLLFCAATAMHSQCTAEQRLLYAQQKPAVEKDPNAEPLLPEAGYLSDTSYTSQFFGFSFDLPLNVQGHQIMLPLMPEKEHVLLALQYEKETHNGYITVTAVDPAPGLEGTTPEQEEQQMKAWARSGGPSGSTGQFPIPDYMLHHGRFYYALRHKGPNYAAQYWTNINNYAVKVVIATNDQEFLRKAKNDMAQVRFYCAQDDGTLTTKEGKPVKPEGAPYEGPTVPTFRVNAAIRDQPARSIPLGGVSGAVYRNPDLGLQYDIPKGWEPLAAKGTPDPPRDDTAMRESAFLHACSQTLLRLAPGAGDEAKPQEPRPMIVLRALDPTCLSMRTATRLGDKRTVDEVAADLEELGEFGEIATDEMVSISGLLFMVFHGTIAATTTGDDLASRMSQSIFAARYNKLLLVWSLMAPTTAALNEIPTSGITLAGSPPIELRTALRAQK